MDKQLHPTVAGLLMFGNEYNIVKYFPEYFLDYREVLDPTIRWTDRLQSSSGERSGNISDFYFRVYNKIIKDIKVPLKIKGGDRIDDTPVHEALREVLANCLINADFHGVRDVVIKKEPEMLIMENPGYSRTGKIQMRKGGVSDPRNKTLMKMLNLINIGERAGSGVPNIFNVWLEFKKKQAKKTNENMDKIRKYLQEYGESTTSDIAAYIELSPARTRVIITEMDDVKAVGGNRNRAYKLR